MTREGNLVVLRHFLGKLPQDELVESVVTVIPGLCDKDEELSKIVTS